MADENPPSTPSAMTDDIPNIAPLLCGSPTCSNNDHSASIHLALITSEGEQTVTIARSLLENVPAFQPWLAASGVTIRGVEPEIFELLCHWLRSRKVNLTSSTRKKKEEGTNSEWVLEDCRPGDVGLRLWVVAAQKLEIPELGDATMTELYCVVYEYNAGRSERCKAGEGPLFSEDITSAWNKSDTPSDESTNDLQEFMCVTEALFRDLRDPDAQVYPKDMWVCLARVFLAEPSTASMSLSAAVVWWRKEPVCQFHLHAKTQQCPAPKRLWQRRVWKAATKPATARTVRDVLGPVHEDRVQKSKAPVHES